MRRSFLAFSFAAALALAWVFAPVPAHAFSKDMDQLKFQVQQLQDMLQHLQQSNDERMGVLQHLVEQSADNVNRMAQQITALQGQIEQNSKNDTIPGQLQSLNDSVDELKTRFSLVTKQLADMQSQLQNVQSQPAPQTFVPPQPALQSYSPPPTGNQPVPAAVPGVDPPLGPGQIVNYGSNTAGRGSANRSSTGAPPVEQLYQSALRDYNGARYPVATSEFVEVMKNYPQHPLAGNSTYYLGEISYRQGLYPAAIKYYDLVLEEFAGSSKAPAAQLRKAQAEIASDQRDAGVRDLRSLVQRYPATPEGAQGRSLLNGMGVRIVAGKPTAAR